MNYLQNIDQALAAAAKNETVKTGADVNTEITIKKIAGADEKLVKIACDAIAIGRLQAHGFLTELKKEAAAAWNKEATIEGGHVSGSKITESGSVTDKANKLPTNKDNPSGIDETSVKHLTEKNLTMPTKVEKSEKRIKAVSK